MTNPAVDVVVRGSRSFTTTGAGITAVSDNGVVSSSFVRDPDGRLVSMRNGSGRFHYLYDGRGSVVGLTDAGGSRVQAYKYQLYGRRVVTVPDSVDEPFRWNGEYAFNDFAYKIGARFYDASQARWTQVDPVPTEPRYAYAHSDPINNVDPTGTECYNGAGPGGYGVTCTENTYPPRTDRGGGNWLTRLVGDVTQGAGAGCIGGCAVGIFY